MKSLLFDIPIGGWRIPIRGYGVMAALGFVLALLVLRRLARKSGMKEQFVYDLWFAGFIGGWVGARIWYVVQFWSETFAEDPWQIFAIQSGGLVWYGGILGAMVAVIGLLRMKRESILAHLDLIAPAGALGLALGRVGCFLNGCCFGRPTDLPWGVRFPKTGKVAYELADGSIIYEPTGSPAFVHHFHQRLVTINDDWSLAVHPTQIYAALGALALFAMVYWYYGRRKAPGQVFAIYLMLYAPMRFFFEWLRDDVPAALLGLTPAQVMSIGLVVFGAALFAYAGKRSHPVAAASPGSASSKEAPAVEDAEGGET